MKIAFINFWGGEIERGVENWTHDLATGLVARGHHVDVFQNKTLQKNTTYTAHISNFSINWTKKDSKGTLFRRFFIDYWSLLIAGHTISIFPELIRGKYNIVIPTNGGWQVAFVRIATWLARSKMVVVGHSGKGWDERNNLWSFPNCFVALTLEAKKWAQKANPLLKRIVVIPDAVDTVIFSPKGPKAKIALPRPVILSVAAAEIGKNLHLTIDAVAEMEHGSLLVLGGGTNYIGVKSYGDKKLDKRFEMKKVDFRDIPKYYRASDAFTLCPWENEAFGMVYLEAMASGLGIVATDDSIRREIVGNAGVFVDPKDSKTYAKMLEKVINREYKHKALKQSKKFSWDVVTQKYEKLFNSL